MNLGQTFRAQQLDSWFSVTEVAMTALQCLYQTALNLEAATKHSRTSGSRRCWGRDIETFEQDLGMHNLPPLNAVILKVCIFRRIGNLL